MNKSSTDPQPKDKENLLKGARNLFIDKIGFDVNVDTDPDEENQEDKENVESDTYLSFSFTMPELYIISITPCFLFQKMMSYFKDIYTTYKDSQRTTIIILLIFSPLIILVGLLMMLLMLVFLLILVIFLMLPGLATPAIQLVSFGYVISEIQTEFDENASYLQNVIVMKIFVLFVLLCMVTNEVTQAANSAVFTYSKAKNKHLYFGFLCFVPQIIQLLMAFILFYVSIMVIVISETSVDCIQNFAGLYILLDLDLTIMQFLRTTKFTALLIYIKRLSIKTLKKELEGKEVFDIALMKEVFNKSEVELDILEEKKSNPHVKKVLLGLRMLAVLFLMVVMMLAWISIYVQMN